MNTKSFIVSVLLRQTINVIQIQGKLKRISRHSVKMTYSVLIKRVSLQGNFSIVMLHFFDDRQHLP